MVKRIHCFTESLAGGGAEHQMAILASLLSERGYDVTIATYSDAADHYPLPEAVKRVRLGQGKTSFAKLLSIFNYFARVKTDCVISYRTNPNTRVLLPMLFRSHKINVICSERGYTSGRASKFEKINAHLLYNRADHIVTNCNAQRMNLMHYRKKWCSRLTTIINYTDTDHFTIKEFPQDNKIMIGVFGNFSVWKNWERLAQVVKTLKEKRFDNFVIDWYGNIAGGRTNYEKFVALIKENELEDYINVYDAVRDTAEFMPKYHVICHPSITEGFSNTISEAICCGRMVTVGDVSDNSLMARPGENGILFNPLDIDDMVAAFENLLHMQFTEIESYGRRSREIAEELFDKERFINSYIELIES